MPGAARWTRAIIIAAPPEAVWPWLVQFGHGRGGRCSYDWLEDVLGFDIHSATRILPEHQQLVAGDPIWLARGICLSKVTQLVEHRWLGWQQRDEADVPVWAFTLGQSAEAGAGSRLVVRGPRLLASKRAPGRRRWTKPRAIHQDWDGRGADLAEELGAALEVDEEPLDALQGMAVEGDVGLVGGLEVGELQSSCGPSSQLPRFAGLQGCGGPTGFVVKGAVDVDPRRAGSPGGAQRQRAGRRM